MTPRAARSPSAMRGGRSTVHLVYPHGPRVSCPDAIGRKLGERLRAAGYRVVHHGWDEMRAIAPAPGDVLLGHPHPAPWTVFRRSARRRGWRRVLAMSPYHHGDRVQVAFLDDVLPHCDLYLAITGRYWFERVAASPFAHWAPMMRHLDLAVDRDDFPVTKRTFAPPGLRRVVYIGHSGWTKNPGYLSAIAAAAPEIAIGWVGGGKAGIPGLRPLGYHDFATDAGRASVAGYDFMLTVGRADANPTTILEAMAWGLIPVCTPESGYAGYPGIVNVPLDRPEEAAGVLRALQEMPDARLRAMQADNWAMLDRHFNWDRFARDVVAAVESGEAPGTTPVSRTHRWALRASAYGAPSAPWRPGQLRGAVRSVLDVVRRRATSARARSTL